MIKAIFFDAVGTLILLPRSVGEHYQAVAARFGADIPATDLQQAFRRAWSAAPLRPAIPGPRPEDDKGWWRALVANVLEQTLPNERRAAFPGTAYFEAVYAHFAQPQVWTLFPEAVEVLGQLSKAGYRLGVISNFDRRLDAILTGLGVRRFFEQVIVSSECGADKPEPQIFRCALAALGVEPHEAVHAGDDRKCDGGASALGMPVFHLERPGTTLRDLPGWLARLPKLAQEDLPPAGAEAK
jgi:putative hydrolase of the HAD superfamily